MRRNYVLTKGQVKRDPASLILESAYMRSSTNAHHLRYLQLHAQAVNAEGAACTVLRGRVEEAWSGC